MTMRPFPTNPASLHMLLKFGNADQQRRMGELLSDLNTNQPEPKNEEKTDA